MPVQICSRQPPTKRPNAFMHISSTRICLKLQKVDESSGRIFSTELPVVTVRGIGQFSSQCGVVFGCWFGAMHDGIAIGVMHVIVAADCLQARLGTNVPIIFVCHYMTPCRGGGMVN